MIPATRASSAARVSPDLSVVGFLGCDGVGTTTHAAHAAEFLGDAGFDTHTEWMRFDHRLSLPVLALGRVLGKTRTHEHGNHALRAHHFEESRLLSWAYRRTFAVDQRAMVRRTFDAVPEDADAVVCDRFILDGLVDLVVSTGDPSLLEGPLAEDVWNLVPDRAVVVGLDCDPETIARRRPDVAPDPFLEFRTDAYRRLYEDDRIDVVDTSQPIADARADVESLLADLCEGSPE